MADVSARLRRLERRFPPAGPVTAFTVTEQHASGQVEREVVVLPARQVGARPRQWPSVEAFRRDVPDGVIGWGVVVAYTETPPAPGSLAAAWLGEA